MSDSPELSKPAGVRGIHGELARRLQVHAGQIADRVVVLGVAQPVRQHHSGIAGILARLVGAHRLDPVDHRLADIVRRLLRSPFGGICFADSFSRTGVPVRIIADHRRHRGIRREVELGGRRRSAMASDAVAGQEGSDGLRELAFEVGIGGFGGVNPGDCDTAKYRKADKREQTTSHGV